MFKRTVAIIVTAAMALGLSACNTETTEATATPEAETPAASTSQPAPHFETFSSNSLSGGQTKSLPNKDFNT